MDKSDKIYVAGHRGMVGSAVVRKLQAEGYNNLILKTRRELDLQNQAAVTEFFDAEKPDIVIFAAARVGGINDGGYLISKKSLDTSNKLYSFGLDDDYSFERDFFKKTNVEVICYDQTVNFKFFLKPFLFGHFSKLFQYLGYRFFFDGKKRKHIKKNIIPRGTFKFNNEVDSADINLIIKENPSNDIFFKIDIEGSELKLLDDLKYINFKLLQIELINNNEIKDNLNFVKNLSQFCVFYESANFKELSLSEIQSLIHATLLKEPTIDLFCVNKNHIIC